jgi:hypothetical protein
MSKSTLSTIADVWNLLGEYVNPDERAQLADSVIMLLLEQDYELDDLRAAFDGDGDMIDAIKFYSEEAAEDYDTDSEYDDLEYDEDEYDE